MTEDQREKVIQLLKEKWTSNQIAIEVGVTRNAVCGLRHRYNKKKIANPEERIGVEARKGRKARKVQKIYQWRAKPKLAPPMEFKEVEIVPDTSKMLHELKDNECKFAVTSHNEVPSKHRFCGKPQRDKSPYCEEHHKVCREPLNVHKRNKVHLTRGTVRLPSGLSFHY